MTTQPRDQFASFVTYASSLRGDEKGEAQVFLDRLFRAFGHAGCKEAGAEMEPRIRARGRKTRFADLLWSPRVLIEMKKRGQNLHLHYDQVRDYWHDTYPKPQYVVLCNFDEFWIYDFFNQSEAVDQVRLADLPERYLSLAFLLPGEKKPQFGNDRVAVSRKAAASVAQIFNELIARGEERARAQRFVLQCVFCLFAEDFHLLPKGLFSGLIDDCRGGASTFDLFGGLFTQMNTKEAARGGKFRGVDHFNGGLFATIEPIDLTRAEIGLLAEAAQEDWSKVQPPIFGALFEGSMGKEERHAFGAHFTAEADIKKVVRPTIERPWLERIDAAKTLKELTALREELLKFRVLDPACGCGNFLYVAYREMRRLEMRILTRIHTKFGKKARQEAGTRPLLSLRQFHGIDINGFAVELAKVVLMLAKEQGIEEVREALATGQLTLPLEQEPTLPLDNLDENILHADALFCEWPEAEAIIGNPPYLGSRYLAREHGYPYANRVHATFPDVPKMADFCSFWFRLAHDRLASGGTAGLVGTNTIRQNETREASLDYIVDHGGEIVEAVSSQPWSGEAQVHVSIVNWVRMGGAAGEVGPPIPKIKKLYTLKGDKNEGAWTVEELANIGPALSSGVDVTDARSIRVNSNSECVFVGQYPYNEGFFLTPEEVIHFTKLRPSNRTVIHPWLTGSDLTERGGPSKYVIDLGQVDVLEAKRFPELFRRLEETVMPVVLAKAEAERKAKGKESTRYTRVANRWWQFYDYRPGVVRALAQVPRYIATSRVTKRPTFEFVDSRIRPDTGVVAFSLPDD